MVTILLALPSCRSLDPATLHHATQHYTTLHLATQHYTIQDRDSIHTRDSTFTSERQRGDTIYRERVVFRDRVEYRDRYRDRVIRDTIIQTDSIVQVIEHPPRVYTPSFYKWSTLILWLGIVLFILYLILRSKLL